MFSKSIRVSSLLVVSLIVGCSGGIRVVPVDGVVTKDGKPLEKVMVEFWPESDGFRSFGETNSEGKFVLTTHDGERKGATVGSHRIVLKDSAVLGDKFMGRAGENVDMSKGRKPRFGQNYMNSESTPLRAEVTVGATNNFPIEISGK